MTRRLAHLTLALPVVLAVAAVGAVVGARVGVWIVDDYLNSRRA